ncbi:hypothetical protein HRbin20_01126 [bacterium HR20]|nr:hypothetical protein HRbin20_01126 [bacterium HR20]
MPICAANCEDLLRATCKGDNAIAWAAIGRKDVEGVQEERRCILRQEADRDVGALAWLEHNRECATTGWERLENRRLPRHSAGDCDRLGRAKGSTFVADTNGRIEQRAARAARKEGIERNATGAVRQFGTAVELNLHGVACTATIGAGNADECLDVSGQVPAVGDRCYLWHPARRKHKRCRTNAKERAIPPSNGERDTAAALSRVRKRNEPRARRIAVQLFSDALRTYGHATGNYPRWGGWSAGRPAKQAPLVAIARCITEWCEEVVFLFVAAEVEHKSLFVSFEGAEAIAGNLLASECPVPDAEFVELADECSILRGVEKSVDAADFQRGGWILRLPKTRSRVLRIVGRVLHDAINVQPDDAGIERCGNVRPSPVIAAEGGTGNGVVLAAAILGAVDFEGELVAWGDREQPDVVVVAVGTPDACDDDTSATLPRGVDPQFNGHLRGNTPQRWRGSNVDVMVVLARCDTSGVGTPDAGFVTIARSHSGKVNSCHQTQQHSGAHSHRQCSVFG